MRSVLAYILLAAMMLPTLSPWGTVAYYQINKTYIARVLCENRDKPILNCNGKCFLAKKLKEQQEKKDRETTERIENMPFVQLFFMSAFQFFFDGIPIIHLKSGPFFFCLSVYATPTSGILRPPR
jgi:hypothetical protein